MFSVCFLCVHVCVCVCGGHLPHMSVTQTDAVLLFESGITVETGRTVVMSQWKSAKEKEKRKLFWCSSASKCRIFKRHKKSQRVQEEQKEKEKGTRPDMSKVWENWEKKRRRRRKWRGGADVLLSHRWISTNAALPPASCLLPPPPSLPWKSHSQTGPENRSWWLVHRTLCLCVCFIMCERVRDVAGVNPVSRVCSWMLFRLHTNCRNVKWRWRSFKFAKVESHCGDHVVTLHHISVPFFFLTLSLSLRHSLLLQIVIPLPPASQSHCH